MEFIVNKVFTNNFVFSSAGKTNNFLIRAEIEESKRVIVNEIMETEIYSPLTQSNSEQCEPNKEMESSSLIDWELWNYYVDSFPEWKKQAIEYLKEIILFDFKDSIQSNPKYSFDLNPINLRWQSKTLPSSSLEPLVSKLSEFNDDPKKMWFYLFNRLKEKAILLCNTESDKTEFKKVLQFYVDWKNNYLTLLVPSL